MTWFNLPIEEEYEVASREYPNFTLVEVNIKGIALPDRLPNYISLAPQVNPMKGVIISGRMPIWLAAALTHYYHPVAWIATFDPRLGGGVVVASHVPMIKVGQVIPVPR